MSFKQAPKAARVSVAIIVLTASVAGLGAASPARRHNSGNESYMVRQVRHQLLMLPYYSTFDNIEFRVSGYNVELPGQVVRPTLKSDAEAAVKRIEGVERVSNQIEVLPVSFFDDRIRRAEYRAIYGNSVLRKYALQHPGPIHIIVKNGNVTLVGVVLNEMDRNVAGIQANSVPGVFSVTNNLRIEKG
jgi:hyperosmotically inducible protein